MDKDGISDDQDNCPATYNPSQEDSNQNGVGNMCDSPTGPQKLELLPPTKYESILRFSLL